MRGVEKSEMEMVVTYFDGFYTINCMWSKGIRRTENFIQS